MKAITICQPYASALVGGEKRNETRSWTTDYRGPLAIHAHQEFRKGTPSHLIERYAGALRGVVIGIVDLVAVHEMTERSIDAVPRSEREWGVWTPGRFAFACLPILLLPRPVIASAQDGLWEWAAPDDVMGAVEEIMKLRAKHRTVDGTMFSNRICVECGAVHTQLRFAPLDAPCAACSSKVRQPPLHRSLVV